MAAPQLKKSAVVGAGLMGGQIALLLATGSGRVALMSRRQVSLDAALASLRRYADDLHRHDGLNGEPPEAVLGRIQPTTDLDTALEGAAFVVESITEDLEAKQDLFARMVDATARDVLLASNTSGLPITKLAAKASDGTRIAGSHFVQPAHIVPVVEVIRGEGTSDDTMDRITAIWAGLGRFPIRVERDVPGFLVNRLQHAVIREAVHLLASGVASAEDIDAAFRLGLAPRFTTAGPLQQRDINGLRMHVRVAGHLWRTLDGWQEPLAYLQRIVERGDVGLASGRGYYDWTGQDADEVRSQKDASLLARTADVMADWEAERSRTASEGRRG